MDPTIRRAAIEYDRQSDEFVIVLADNPRIHGPDAGAREAIVKHQRFSYAHEFAHRFLFVRREGTWTRALAVVARTPQNVPPLVVARKLTTLEERVCNDVAGRLLVPEDALRGVIDTAVRSSTEPKSHIWRVASTVSGTFGVSWWCAVRRSVMLMPPSLQEALGPSFAFLLFGTSSAKGGTSSATKPRVLDYHWPGRIGTVRIRPLFPGMALDNLGSEITSQVRKLLAGDGWSSGEYSSGLVVHDGSGAERRVVIRGWWRGWAVGSERQVAVHGNLEIEQETEKGQL